MAGRKKLTTGKKMLTAGKNKLTAGKKAYIASMGALLSGHFCFSILGISSSGSEPRKLYVEILYLHIYMYSFCVHRFSIKHYLHRFSIAANEKNKERQAKISIGKPVWK